MTKEALDFLAREDMKFQRFVHYGRLRNIADQTAEMLAILIPAQVAGKYLDLGVRNHMTEYWMAINRPGLADCRPDGKWPELELIEHLIEWGLGIESQAMVDIEQMESYFPYLAKVKRSQLTPRPTIIWAPKRRNWLKRAFKRIF